MHPKAFKHVRLRSRQKKPKGLKDFVASSKPDNGSALISFDSFLPSRNKNCFLLVPSDISLFGMHRRLLENKLEGIFTHNGRCKSITCFAFLLRAITGEAGTKTISPTWYSYGAVIRWKRCLFWGAEEQQGPRKAEREEQPLSLCISWLCNLTWYLCVRASVSWCLHFYYSRES